MITKDFIGIFFILHGFVHLLYMGHSFNYFELEKGFIWPEKSRFLGNSFSSQTKKIIAGIWCIIASISFALAGIFILTSHPWHDFAMIFASLMSTVLFVAFWDGSIRKWHTQGGIAILINLLILFFVFH